MNKSKLVPVILLLIILGVGFVAFSFYTKSQGLVSANGKMKEEISSLNNKHSNLRYKYDKAEQERNEMEQRLFMVKEEMLKVEAERDNIKSKYETASRERDSLAERVKMIPAQQVAVEESSTPTGETVTEEHWADFVRKKASLQAKAIGLQGDLIEAKSAIAGLDRNNKELSIRIDQLSKEKERLSSEIKFKERTLRIMSMDLVSEREERTVVVKEIRKLRKENIGLKRELILSSKEKMKLQTHLKLTMEKKSGLENRIADAENVMKENSLAYEEFQYELEEAISEGKRISMSDSASVELPPIVVKPDMPGLRGIRGEIIAVNYDEKFVVVDTGEASGLRPGVLLKVMRGDKEIATVEVIETRKEISAADIKEVLGGFTIQEGDVVISR